MRTYEGMFIFLQANDDQALEEQLNKVGSEVTKLGGTVTNTTRMGRYSFARTLNRKEAGVFVLITFSMDPKKITVLNKHYRLNNNILRAQIVHAKKTPTETRKTASETAQS